MQVNQSVELVECPQCKEVASVIKNSFTTTIDCKCGIISMDTMIEQDNHFVVYERFMSQYKVIDKKSIFSNLLEDIVPWEDL